MSSDQVAEAVEASTLSADQLDDGLTVLALIADGLKKWEVFPWAEVQRMARSVGPVILEQLVSRRLWDGLTPHDQAAVHWVMAEGHSVGGVGERWVHPDREGPRIESLHQAADHYGALCGARWHPRSYGRDKQIRSGVEFAARFEALPEGWRKEVMRRALSGQGIASAVAQASMYANVLRSVYGIDVRDS
ncbi:hypothetical protein [Streptomyces phaeochromogenes]|uniref:hypothetical protein n=1 Tax=Streptomyces phaeochromogenes TaxID=1923 RepID=UPI002DDB0DA8|nr:hypothetical protein [Streptomyces phaeochromogenes]WRZ30150.1 hypothetical protein OG931_21585 [Streptomyces phaeochromogenes]